MPRRRTPSGMETCCGAQTVMVCAACSPFTFGSCTQSQANMVAKSRPHKALCQPGCCLPGLTLLPAVFNNMCMHAV